MRSRSMATWSWPRETVSPLKSRVRAKVRIISAPRINTPITEGDGLIEGEFTDDELREIIAALGSGALPAKLAVGHEAGAARARGRRLRRPSPRR